MNKCRYCGNNFVPNFKKEHFCSLLCQYQWQLKFCTREMSPFEEMELKQAITDCREDYKKKTCIGCPYISSKRCGELRCNQHSSSASSWMKYRDERCRQRE